MACMQILKRLGFQMGNGVCRYIKGKRDSDIGRQNEKLYEIIKKKSRDGKVVMLIARRDR